MTSGRSVHFCFYLKRESVLTWENRTPQWARVPPHLLPPQPAHSLPGPPAPRPPVRTEGARGPRGLAAVTQKAARAEKTGLRDLEAMS